MTEAKWRGEVRGFTSALVAMKDQAGRLGLWRTMHAMDEATRATGYEQSDIITGKQAQPWKGGEKPRGGWFVSLTCGKCSAWRSCRGHGRVMATQIKTGG